MAAGGLGTWKDYRLSVGVTLATVLRYPPPLLVGLLVGGCHAILPLSPPSARDGSDGASRDYASRDQHQSIDRLPDGSFRPCTEQWKNPRFGPVSAVKELNTEFNEIESTLSADGLRIYFTSTRQGGADLYTSVRGGRGQPFEEPAPLDAINTANAEYRFHTTADGLVAVLNANWPNGQGQCDIWYASRTGLDQAFASNMFSSPKSINSVGNEYDPQLSPDGLRLYYTIWEWPLGQGSADLVVATRISRSVEFSAPQSIPGQGINTPSADDNPTLSADERVIVFTSTRLGSPGHDIWYSTRPSRSAPFDTPQPLDDLNTTEHDEWETFLSGDGCELFFSSDRPGGKGKLDIYRAELQRPP